MIGSKLNLEELSYKKVTVSPSCLACNIYFNSVLFARMMKEKVSCIHIKKEEMVPVTDCREIANLKLSVKREGEGGGAQANRQVEIDNIQRLTDEKDETD